MRGALQAWTTRRWLTAGVGATLAVLLALGVVGTWLFVTAGAVGDRLVKRSTPALIAAVRLENGLVDQETGVRGYALSGNVDFLTPYREGLAQQEAAAARLRDLAADDPAARADLELVVARAATWQREVAEPIAAVPPGPPMQASITRTEAGKASFDRVREALAAQQRQLEDDREQQLLRLDSVERIRNAVLAAIAVVIVAIAVLALLALRRGVTRPLERLYADAERVAGGDFGHPIAATGPADLRHLGAAMESMRRRLHAELAHREQARAELDAQARDLQRSNEELEQFAYVASHDLQEPLRKVASFCQLLQRRYGGQLDARADEYIRYAVDGAARMQTLINDLLRFSRVGRVDVRHEPVDLERVLAGTLDALAVAVEESGAEVTHDPLPTVTGDPTQLGMLFQNLLGNAVKFRSPDRPLRVHVSAERDGDVHRLAVTDNGIGIQAEFAPKVFVIFQRLHGRDAYSGNGIGLALCKKIVEYHGGVIDVDTAHAGPGTRMVFTLPAVPALAGAAAPAGM